MSGRLNHDKAKRQSLGRRGERLADDAPLHPRPGTSLRGWRTEYPAAFPVTITYREDPHDQSRPLPVLADHHKPRARGHHLHGGLRHHGDPVTDPRAWAMLEDRGPDSLDSHVRRLMTDLGLWGYHTADSRRSQRGWPDWTILGPGGALFRELKREDGRLSVDQRRVGSKLTRAGLNWSTWRPSDLFSGLIARQLAAIAGLTKEAA